jgi:hypothetical protein
VKIIPITFRRACEFVAEHHRHNKPPRGHKFSIGLQDDAGNLIGVAMAGRPISRHQDNGLTLEVNRTCTDGTFNANSMLYGAVWRAAKAMGYVRCITYTQHDETGASLRAVGWRRVKDLPPNKGWSVPSRQREDIGSAGIARVLWDISR